MTWTHWTRAVGELGGDGTASAADLAARYAEPHRHYHTGAHVAAVLRDVARLAAELDLPARERTVLVLAACAHDVVYDARPGEDERASAAWTRRALAGLDDAERVAGLVLATITHEPDDLAGAAFLDADLAILAAPEPDYEAYVDAVRAEYASVPDDAWREGRGAVLRGLLARDPIYRTAPARARWESAARANMARELTSDRLRSP